MAIPITDYEIEKKAKSIICLLKTNVHDHKIYRIKLNELRKLVEALGIEVVSEVIQSRHKPFSKYVIGSGKVKDLRRIIKREKIDLVIFYNIIKSSQKLNLIQALKCEVIDRFELTLEIFDRMASDNLSKLQIQSARLEKQAPFYKLQASINYRDDRPFFRSGGEYAFHGQLREISRNQSRIREEINKLMEEKSQRIYQRKRLGYPVICIAGFYNAGKTSLFNTITGENKPVSNRPFTTLSSKYQRRFIDYKTTVLFIDTIGFVLDLDPRLIQSFKLNLLDITSSDLVILLMEITDPPFTLQMKLNEGVRLLKDIGVQHERIMVVFNKLDQNPEIEKKLPDLLELNRYNVPWVSVSALKNMNIDLLLQIIAKKVKELEQKPPTKTELPIYKKAQTVVINILNNFPVLYNNEITDPFKVLVRTILSQNTNSINGNIAFKKLETKIGVNPKEINKTSINEIRETIKPAGMYNIRAERLKKISKIIIESYNGDLSKIINQPYLVARDKLINLPGVGEKTADVTLMFVSENHVIPIDRHIERVSKRLELVPQNAMYDDIRKTLEDATNPDQFQATHLSIIKFGREICRARKPLCTTCILNDLCPYPLKNK